MDKDTQRLQDVLNFVIAQREQALNNLAAAQAQLVALTRELNELKVPLNEVNEDS